jgi:hypothetical protein
MWSRDVESSSCQLPASTVHTVETLGQVGLRLGEWVAAVSNVTWMLLCPSDHIG